MYSFNQKIDRVFYYIGRLLFLALIKLYQLLYMPCIKIFSAVKQNKHTANTIAWFKRVIRPQYGNLIFYINLLINFFTILDEKMHTYAQILSEKFTSWHNIQRQILLVVISLAVILLSYALYISPIYKELNNTQNKINSINRTTKSIDATKRNIIANAKENPNSKLKQRIEVNVDENNQLANEISKYANKQLDTPRLVQIIKAKLQQEEKMSLVRITSLGSYELIPPNFAIKQKNANIPQVLVNPVEVEISGNYQSIYNFLTSLEKDWSIYWSDLEYIVDNHPKAYAIIKLHTMTIAEKSND